MALLVLLRTIAVVVSRKSRTVPYYVRAEIKDDEQPDAVYYERLRVFEGLILCGIGLYFFSRIYSDPVYSFNGTFIACLIFGFVFLALGIPLCFVCSGGCAVITKKRVIIYRTRCFAKDSLNAVPKNEILRACRITAGAKGVVSSFFSLIFAFIKGDTEKVHEMYDRAFLNGCLEVCAADRSYRIRLSSKQADEALNDIAELCGSKAAGGKRTERKFSYIKQAISIISALAVALIFGIALTSNARKTVEKQYIKAVYLQDTEAFSQAYVEFEHLSERYSYRDSDFRAKYCYARLEMYQGNYRRAAEQIYDLPEFDEKKDLLYSCAFALEQENSAALAADIYTALGDYKDCRERLALINDAYNAAIEAFDSRDYVTAAQGFSLLRDYKETPSYVSLLCTEADKLTPPKGNPEKLESKEIVSLCEQAQTILEHLLWDSECAKLNALCEEYLSVYKFD